LAGQKPKHAQNFVGVAGGTWSFADKVAVFWVIVFSVGVVLLSFGKENHELTVIGAMMVGLAFGLIIGYGFYLGKNEKKSDKTGDRKPTAIKIGDSRLQTHLIESSKSCSVPLNISVKATMPNTKPRLVIQFPPTDSEIANPVSGSPDAILGDMMPSSARRLGKNSAAIAPPQKSAQIPLRHFTDSAKLSDSARRTPSAEAIPSPRNSGSLNKSIVSFVLYGVNYTLKNLSGLTAIME
jgi:hypothetical protein